MLYDKKWDEKKVAAPAHDPLSLDGLIAWLRTMPEDGEYNYRDIHGCLGCEWIRATGRTVYALAGDEYNPACNVDDQPIFDGFDDIAVSHPWTYGAALERALALRNPHAGRAG